MIERRPRCMQLKLLLSKVQTRQVRGPLDVDISSICYDSRQAKPGALFVAMRGGRVDGHEYVEQAGRTRGGGRDGGGVRAQGSRRRA